MKMKQFSQINRYFKMIVLFAFMAVLSFSVNAQTLQLQGEGTESNPYKITSITDLRTLSSFINTGLNNPSSLIAGKYFELTTDLDFINESKFAPIGNSYARYFSGKFNGNGHIIKNIKILEGNSNCVGIFGFVNIANWNLPFPSIENLGVVGAQVNGKQCVGAIAGQVEGCAYIKDCYVTNSDIKGLSAKYQAASVGALVGKYNDCYAGTVSYCYSQGNTVQGSNWLGGIIGDNHIRIENCYSTSEIKQADVDKNNRQIGPITGTQGSSQHASVINCYYLEGWSTNGYTTNNENGIVCYGISQTEDELKSTVQELLIGSGTDFSLDVLM
jgi:hypothetical protein